MAIDPEDIPLTDEQRQELEDRVQEYREHPGDTASWEVVEGRLRSQIAGCPGVEKAWIAEVRERIAAYDRGEVESIPGDEVMARAREIVGTARDRLPVSQGGKMIREHDLVVLKRDDPEYGLEAGDVGAVVAVHEGDVYEVEFVSAEGETVAVLTLTDADLRPMTGNEILHVRNLASF